MARKEVLAYLVAHNLIRCVMAEAALVHDARLDRLSFKGTLDPLRQYSAVIARARSRSLRRQLWQDLLLNLVRDEVPWRPDRREPRAVKRRPKEYPLLNRPRRQFVEISHRSRYWKGRPRNYRALNQAPFGSVLKVDTFCGLGFIVSAFAPGIPDWTRASKPPSAAPPPPT